MKRVISLRVYCHIMQCHFTIPPILRPTQPFSLAHLMPITLKAICHTCLCLASSIGRHISLASLLEMFLWYVDFQQRYDYIGDTHCDRSMIHVAQMHPHVELCLIRDLLLLQHLPVRMFQMQLSQLHADGTDRGLFKGVLKVLLSLIHADSLCKGIEQLPPVTISLGSVNLTLNGPDYVLRVSILLIYVAIYNLRRSWGIILEY